MGGPPFPRGECEAGGGRAHGRARWAPRLRGDRAVRMDPLSSSIANREVPHVAFDETGAKGRASSFARASASSGPLESPRSAVKTASPRSHERPRLTRIVGVLEVTLRVTRDIRLLFLR